jgi:hypothetical protein
MDNGYHFCWIDDEGKLQERPFAQFVGVPEGAVLLAPKTWKQGEQAIRERIAQIAASSGVLETIAPVNETFTMKHGNKAHPWGGGKP